MKNVLVTGAGRGLGLELTRQLVSRGDRVFATVRAPARAGDLGTLEAEVGDRLAIEALDAADDDSIRALRQSVGTKTATLDLLINCAGINSKGVPAEQANMRFGSLEPLGIERMIRVNAIAPVLMAQAFVDLLEASGAGAIVSISSWLGSISQKTSGSNYGYCASKTTLNMLTRAMAFDLLPRGITSVVINPGWVATDMGGSSAKLTPTESAAGILRVADALTAEQAGQFLQWDGSEHPW